MALSDAEREKTLKRSKSRAVDAGTNKRWSDSQKLEAIHAYLALGNLALVSRLLSIPEITLRVWKASDWWKQVVEDSKLQERIELSNRMKKLVDAAQTIVAQRLETGDPVITPKGDLVYKPVSMKDAHKVATDLLDRRKMVETGEGPVTEEGKDTKLERLAERFAEMATKSIQKAIDKDRTIDVQDAYIKAEEGTDDALHDQWQARLQEGKPTLQQPPGTNQEEVGTDHSPSAG